MAGSRSVHWNGAGEHFHFCVEVLLDCSRILEAREDMAKSKVPRLMTTPDLQGAWGALGCYNARLANPNPQPHKGNPSRAQTQIEMKSKKSHLQSRDPYIIHLIIAL